MVAADDFGTTPADNDGGMMYFEAYGGGSCGLVTGKIDLGDIISPAFIFQVFNYLSSSPNENIVSVDINAGDGYVNAFNSTVMECGTPGQWNKVTVPLDEYAGQTVTIRISATNKTFGFTHIDDLRVTSVAPYNLGIRSVDAPSSVERNTGFDITVEIETSVLSARSATKSTSSATASLSTAATASPSTWKKPQHSHSPTMPALSLTKSSSIQQKSNTAPTCLKPTTRPQSPYSPAQAHFRLSPASTDRPTTAACS